MASVLFACTDDGGQVVDLDDKDNPATGDKDNPTTGDKDNPATGDKDNTKYDTENPKREPSEPPTTIILPKDPNDWKNPSFDEVYRACAYSDPVFDEVFITVPSGESYNGNSEFGKTIASFELMKREVTRESYRKCVKAGVCTSINQKAKYDSDRVAVSNVYSDDAKKYCEWIGGRLPTYDEWMYAASYNKNDDHRIFPWGMQFPDFCVNAAYAENGWNCVNGKVVREDLFYQASIVGCYPAGDSELGFQDMAGNVMEWVYRDSQNYYTTVGGASDLGLDFLVLYSKEDSEKENFGLEDVGFRCARDISQ